MPKENDIPFLEIIKEVFDQVFTEYGFELQGEAKWNGMGEYEITATKEDIALNFYLGLSQLFYYCDVSLALSGELGKRATADPKYRRIGASVIARCLDPMYQRSTKMPQTKEEVKQKFEERKEDLLKYCSGILTGDISIWPKVVKCVKRKKR
jgi:hypothetical protein